MNPYIYSITQDTLNGKVDSDKLSAEIHSSAIATALDYIATAADVLSIYFKADLSAGDETILTGIVQSHTGQSGSLPDVTSEGVQRVAIRVDVDAVTARKTAVNGDGSYTNFCDIVRFPADGSGAPAEWAPLSGYRIEIKHTQLTVTPDVLMEKQLLFKIINGGEDGSVQKTIPYNQFFDFVSEALNIEETSMHRKFTWVYEPTPIILRAKYGAKIQILQPAGAQGSTGGNGIARVKLTYGVLKDS